MKFINSIFTKKYFYFLTVFLLIALGLTVGLIKDDNFILKRENGWLIESFQIFILPLIIIIHFIFYYKNKNIDKYFAYLMLFLFGFFLFLQIGSFVSYINSNR